MSVAWDVERSSIFVREAATIICLRDNLTRFNLYPYTENLKAEITELADDLSREYHCYTERI